MMMMMSHLLNLKHTSEQVLTPLPLTVSQTGAELWFAGFRSDVFRSVNKHKAVVVVVVDSTNQSSNTDGATPPRRLETR